jgi:hypothetical protein
MALAFDRTKDAHLVNETMREKNPGFSMGTLLTFASCSICGLRTDGIQHCPVHIGNKDAGGPENRFKGRVFQGRVAYENLHFINGFEGSKVNSPADVRARARRQILMAA